MVFIEDYLTAGHASLIHDGRDCLHKITIWPVISRRADGETQSPLLHSKLVLRAVPKNLPGLYLGSDVIERSLRMCSPSVLLSGMCVQGLISGLMPCMTVRHMQSWCDCINCMKVAKSWLIVSWCRVEACNATSLVRCRGRGARCCCSRQHPAAHRHQQQSERACGEDAAEEGCGAGHGADHLRDHHSCCRAQRYHCLHDHPRAHPQGAPSTRDTSRPVFTQHCIVFIWLQWIGW